MEQKRSHPDQVSMASRFSQTCHNIIMCWSSRVFLQAVKQISFCTRWDVVTMSKQKKWYHPQRCLVLAAKDNNPPWNGQISLLFLTLHQVNWNMASIFANKKLDRTQLQRCLNKALRNTLEQWPTQLLHCLNMWLCFILSKTHSMDITT